MSSELHALRHLVAHLDAAGQHDRLHRLVLADRDWMERKFAALEDDGAYLQDIEIALRRFADPLPPSDLLVVAQLFAARCAVRLRGESSAVEDLIVLTMEGRVRAALAQARLRVAPENRCGDLLAIHRVLRRGGQIDRDLLDEIRDRAFAIEVERERAYAFAALGEELALSGFRDLARRAFERADEALALMKPDLFDRLWVLQALATTRARAGFFSDALDAARSINHPFYLAWTVADVAPSAPESGAALRLLAQAELLASRLEAPGQEIIVLQSVLLGFGSVGVEVEVRRMLGKLHQFAATNEGDRAIRALAIGLAEMGRCKEAEDALNDLQEEWAQGDALKAIAVAWGRTRHWNRAEQAAAEIATPKVRRNTLRRLAVLAAEAGDHSEAWRFLEKARALTERALDGSRLLLSLAAVESGPPAPPAHTQDEMLVPSEKGRLQALAQDAVRLAESEDEAAARVLLHELEATVWPITTYWEATIWQTLAIAHSRLGESGRARDILYDLAQKRRLACLDNLNRRDEARRAARAAAECGAFMLAFEMLEVLPSNMFSSELDLCAPAFERLGSGLAVAIRTEAARILSWRSSLGKVPEKTR